MTDDSSGSSSAEGAFVESSLARIDTVDVADQTAVSSLLEELAAEAEERGMDALAERARAAAERVRAEPEIAAQELDAVRGGVALADAFSDLGPPPAKAPAPYPRPAPTPEPTQETTQEVAHDGPQAETKSDAPETSDPRIVMFCDEGLEQLDTVESALLSYEKHPGIGPINEAFRALHTLKGNSGWLGLSELETAAHALEDLLDRVRSGEEDAASFKPSVVLERVDVLRASIRALRAGPQSERGDAGAGDGQDAAAKLRRAAASVRVDVHKLDSVFDEVGELITAVAAVIKSPDLEGQDLPNFQVAASQLTRVAQSLHDSAAEMRMVPLESLFRKAARLVRDASADLGKDIALHIDGADIEVDRSIVETLTDPLLHLIRNAVDHGIEPAAVRSAGDKPEQGNLYLGAYHEGTEVVVSVRDDGRGIDVDRLLAKARAAGLVPSGEEPTRQEVLEFLFERGLSTTAEVSKYSGRGVGMDIVRSQVEAIRGTVRVETTKGQGTIFYLHLPMRLAMIDTMVVRAGTAIYAFPLLSIAASTQIGDVKRTQSPELGTLVQMRGRTMPLVDFSDLYETHVPSDSDLVLVVDCGTQELCLRVDEIVGQRQVVVKPLGPYLGNVRAIIGCSLLGRGDLCLIVDPRQFPSILCRQTRRVAS
ncbi:MAG: chemotaxis protein CheA [Nannocystaceae bacterium]|nr:ATP-binding protein [bacterium]